MAVVGKLELLIVSALLLLTACYSNVQRGYKTTLKSVASSEGKPWPIPQLYIPTPTTYTLNSDSFKINPTGKTCDTLVAAMTRYYNVIFYPGRQNDALRFKPISKSKLTVGTELPYLNVNLENDCEIYPSLDMDEWYQLFVKSDGAILTARSIWGALRGLETFSQLVYQTPDGTFTINDTKIEDYPRFSHRGLLIDTSRHFVPKKILLQNLDAMAYNKYNVFHWHIVDDQSFPYQSRHFPELSNLGAYDPHTHVYSQQDVAEIIEYARQRGIRVIPEFDTPGHSESWGPAIPGLLTPCYKSGQPDGSYGPIDPTKNSTYDFLKVIVMEWTKVFPDKYVHLGGDEVSFDCWKSNPAVTQFMQKMGYGTDYSKLEQYYMQNILNIVSSDQDGYVIWQEVVDNGVKVRPDTVVEVWKGGYPAEMSKVTQIGLRTILASPWYLDYISYGTDWPKYYRPDPHNFNGTDAQKKLVIGGEACMWGEYVDGTNLISRLWPRASAVAERLWSPKQYNNTAEAAPRIEEHRCRMLRRGLNAEPANGPGFCKYEMQVN
ncbi:beta-hexosaminidase subunit alpha-like isoform X3 [Lingula anatina]|uniref:Beta-hexosaminidase n=1 Tax=Lingula anatina TaxID=7574 RepID=A0A1S3HJI4_LINAN|nr:beta-hexosaminidase subunit alpha-like isoform X3 [Lingula anatina]|eukprot:XP_013385149.1 beta-hexosaminidase subunit alpha-like isoform X3 [Lingula anatina]